MTLSPSDCYPWKYYIFFVNNDVIITSLLHISAGRGTHSTRLRNCPAAEANDTRLHTTNTVATQQQAPKPRGLCMREIMQERVYKKKIKRVGELRQLIVEEWEQLGQHVILTIQSDSSAGDCEAVLMQMVDSLNILCD